MLKIEDSRLLQRLVRSIFPEARLHRNTRRGSRFLLNNLALHFRPTRVPRETLRFSLTWGLGGMAATLVLLQVGTGVLLKFFYVPTPAAAYASVQSIIFDVPFGRLVRNLHHWCAHLLVVAAILHMLRGFFTGAFHPPRQFNWIIGLSLLCMVLLANFTGYLLPWDQLAYWAVTVSTGMLDYVPIVGAHIQAMIRDGTEIGPRTLQVFFGLHTAVIPAVLLGLMAFHFWRVRKAGGLVIPRRPGRPPVDKPLRVPSVPDLLMREIVTALALIAVVMLVSATFDAPLTGQANPGLSPNPTRAPWYFAGLQELLLHFHPVFAVCVIPGLLACGLLAIPYLIYDVDTGGIWFASRNGRITAGIAALAGAVLTLLLVLADEKLASSAFSIDGLPSMVRTGLIPTMALATAIAAFLLMMKKWFSISRNEAVQAAFVLILTGYGMLTFIGIWFRGPGMVLATAW
jgi:quinol-cytochrome oxidoreductase complex cytochrome b subunit